MRKIYLTLLAFLVLPYLPFNVQEAMGQCTPRSNAYYGECLPNNGCGSFAAYSSYGPGEYFRMPVLLGANYSISTCGNSIDTQITGFQGNNTTTSIFYNDDNGPICSGLQSSISYTSTFTDYLRVNVNQYNCRPGGTACITVRVRQNNNLNFTSSTSSMCQGQTRTLTASPAPVGSAATGSGNLGTFSGTGVSGSTFTGPTPAGASATYTQTYEFGYCSTTSTITVFKNPTISNAGANQTVCSTTATLAGNSPTVGSGTWSVVSGPGTITSPNSPTSTVTGLQYGQSTVLRWTITNGPCTSSNDDVTITVDPLPTTANAGPDQNVCASTATLAGNTPSVGSGTWTLVGGSGTITSPNSPTSGVTGLGSGANTFRWTITNSSCTPSTDDVVINRDVNPTTAIAGPDQFLCDSVTTLAGNSASVGNGMWSVISGTASITTPSSPTSGVTGIGVGTAVLKWEITNGSCTASNDTVEITRYARPGAPTITGTVSVCEGSSTTLTASSSASGPTFVWWDASSGGNSLSSNPTFNTGPLTTATTFWITVNDSSTSCTSQRYPVAISILPLPTVNLGADTTTCAADTICLDAGAGQTAYSWSTGDTTQTTCVVGGGTIFATVTDTNSCSNSDSVVINTTPNPVVNLGADTTLCPATTITLGDPAVAGNTYSWNTSDTTSQITVSAAGTYSLSVVDSNGCDGNDEINIAAGTTTVAAFAVDSSACPVITFNDQSTAANGWSWTFGDGNSASTQSPSNDYSAAGNGTYTVTLVSTGDCNSDTTTVDVVINCLVAIADEIQGADVKIYPNPNSGNFKIEVSELTNDPFVIQIFNTSGQMVYELMKEDHNGSFTQEIQLNDHPAGIYYVKMVAGAEKITRRVIIQK